MAAITNVPRFPNECSAATLRRRNVFAQRVVFVKDHANVIRPQKHMIHLFLTLGLQAQQSA
jgi:hypothetical protein